MDLPIGVKKVADLLGNASADEPEASRLAAAPRDSDVELAIAEAYNAAWRQSRRGSRLTFVRAPLIRKSDKVMTIGSCFALEMRLALKALGFDVRPRYADVDFDRRTQKLAKLPAKDDISHFNTFTIRAEFEHAFADAHYAPGDFLRQRSLPHKVFEEPVGDIWEDPYRKDIYGTSEAAIVDLSRKIDACIRDAILTSDVYVITLGLTEVWRNDANGLVVNYVPNVELDGTAPGFTFEQSTYEQNYDNMRAVCALITEHFPEKKIVLTVSPVALSRTFSGNDVVVANMESKSTLRAVAGVIAREFDNVTYWPSYEIALARDIFKPDGRHVTPGGVKAIVDQFLAVHLDA